MDFCEFKARLVYKVSFRPARAIIEKPCFRKKEKKRKEKKRKESLLSNYRWGATLPVLFTAGVGIN